MDHEKSVVDTATRKRRKPWNKGLTKHDHPSLAKVAKAKAKWWAADPRVETRRKIGKTSVGRIKSGAGHPAWKGGRRQDKRDGYIYVYAPDHPRAIRNGQGNGPYILEHRLVMEQHLGRYLTADEDVHHRNGIKDDNRIENLELVPHGAHYGLVVCPHCQRSFRIK